MSNSFERRKKAPLWYLNFAEKHLVSVQILEHSIENKNYGNKVDSSWGEHFDFSQLDPVVNMLRGLALELLLKAVYVSQNHDKYPPETHRLIDLADKCNIDLKTNQKNILKLLTNYIRFAGRYPTAKKEKEQNDFYNNYTSQLKKVKVGNISITSHNLKGKSYLSQKNFKEFYSYILSYFNE